MERRIHVTAVVLRDASGAVLLVRKRGTTMWMNPGGKPEPGESPEECGAREVSEELGLHLDPARLEPLGLFEAAAANEPGHVVVAHVFSWPERVVGPVLPAAEIDAVRWSDPLQAVARTDRTLAPLYTDAIAPLL
ncbi:NUDIX hydrolase [Tessaracoccus sp. Z1128]